MTGLLFLEAYLDLRGSLRNCRAVCHPPLEHRNKGSSSFGIHVCPSGLVTLFSPQTWVPLVPESNPPTSCQQSQSFLCVFYYLLLMACHCGHFCFYYNKKQCMSRQEHDSDTGPDLCAPGDFRWAGYVTVLGFVSLQLQNGDHSTYLIGLVWHSNCWNMSVFRRVSNP